MVHLKESYLEKTEENNEKCCLIERKYSNYKFYFIQTREGLREIKHIHIYEQGKKYLTLEKPWFNKKDSVVFESNIKQKNYPTFDNEDIFCVPVRGKKQVELYIPNSITRFEKVGSVDTEGFYKKIEIYESKNAEFGYHKEEVKKVEDKDFIKKLKDTCLNSKKAMSLKE